jgi:hypothetical protein
MMTTRLAWSERTRAASSPATLPPSTQAVSKRVGALAGGCAATSSPNTDTGDPDMLMCFFRHHAMRSVGHEIVWSYADTGCEPSLGDSVDASRFLGQQRNWPSRRD